MKLKRKRVIITGGASGLGKELTLQLLAKDAYVTVLDINTDNLNKLKEEVNNEHLSTYTLDISDYDAIDKFKEKYLEDNVVDILINNAGIIQPFINIENVDDKIINKVMGVNFFGPLRLTRIFLKHILTRPEGYIVNISSMGGFFPFPGQTIYGASKSALKLFTEGLYAELLDTKVKVMIAFPGAMNTNIAKNSEINIKNDSNSNYKTLDSKDAANIIIKGIKKNKFQLYVGNDSKIMHFLYKLNPKSAIKIINKKMKDLKQ